MLSFVAKQIHEAILKAESILLIPHQNPDGDALGSSTAFGVWLGNIEKDFTIFCKTPHTPRFSYLPLEKFTTDPAIWEKPFDVVIVFDSGDLRYAGVSEEIARVRDQIVLIDIDHHATNEFFGDLNFVDTKASSTSEMVQRFFSINHISLQKEIANGLLTGFITDTDNFTNAATSPFALSAVSQLLRSGGRMDPIQNRVYKNISISALKVWGKMMNRLTKNEMLDIVSTYITQEDIREAGIQESDVDGLANFMNMIDEGRAKMILKELEPGLWKGSFRTTRDDLDVSAWAAKMNGGGHKKAAGFKVEGTIEEALSKIFTIISE